MLTRLVNGERVEISAAEESDILAEWASNAAEDAIARTEKKRKRLIEAERQKAIDATIAAQKDAIENMNDAALDAAIAALND